MVSRDTFFPVSIKSKLADVIKENLLLFCIINCSFVSAFTYLVSLRYFSVGIINHTELDTTDYSPASLRSVISPPKRLVGFQVISFMIVVPRGKTWSGQPTSSMKRQRR